LGETPASFTVQSFVAADGYPLRYRRYDPPGGPGRAQGCVVCIHGVASHAGWYEYSCRKISEAGYTVAFLDRRGAGMNHLARGDTPSFRRLVDDLAEFLEAFPERLQKMPVLMAISWGGKLALALERRRPGRTSALALLCPGIFPRVGPPLRHRLGIAWSRLVSPARLFPVPLSEPELFTANPRWQDFIRTDPLFLRQATARFFFESVRLDWYIQRAGRHVRVPLLLILAGEDRIIDNARTRRFIEQLPTEDKLIREYEGAHHTLEFEPNPDHYLGDLLKWLRLKSPVEAKP
jgi:alpha-beta hydrolase superfamily lysophospholipase